MDTAAFITALAMVATWVMVAAFVIALVSSFSIAGTAAYALLQRLRGSAPAHVMALSWKALLFITVVGAVFACLAAFMVVSAAGDLLSKPVGWRSLIHLFWVVAPPLSVWQGWASERAKFARMTREDRNDRAPELAA